MQPCPVFPPIPWHPSIGVFIGLLGFLGVVVPLIREKIGRWEKAVWTLLFAACLLLELRSIQLDERQHDHEQATARCEEIENFGKIADGINRALTTSQEQFKETMKGLNTNLNETRTAVRSAEEARKNSVPHAESVLINVQGDDKNSISLRYFEQNAPAYVSFTYRNAGTGVAKNFRKLLKVYAGKRDDHAAQQSLAAKFELDWSSLLKDRSTAVSVSPGNNPELATSPEELSRQDIDRIRAGTDTIYIFFRAQYTDLTGAWISQLCEGYQEPINNVEGITHHCIDGSPLKVAAPVRP